MFKGRRGGGGAEERRLWGGVRPAGDTGFGRGSAGDSLVSGSCELQDQELRTGTWQGELVRPTGGRTRGTSGPKSKGQREVTGQNDLE